MMMIIMMFNFIFFFLCKIVGVDAVPEYDKAVVQIFGDEIERHVDAGGHVVIPAQCSGEKVAESGGSRGEHTVKERHQQHGLGDVVGRLEGKFPI